MKEQKFLKLWQQVTSKPMTSREVEFAALIAALEQPAQQESVGEALRIADLLERDPSEWGGLSLGWKAAAELRRLQTLNQELLEALKELLRCPSGEYDTTDDYENACKKAEAAIAKAGKTK